MGPPGPGFCHGHGTTVLPADSSCGTARRVVTPAGRGRLFDRHVLFSGMEVADDGVTERRRAPNPDPKMRVKRYPHGEWKINVIAAGVSRRGESHPPPLSGPDVTISRHPAPTVRPEVVRVMRCQ